MITADDLVVDGNEVRTKADGKRVSVYTHPPTRENLERLAIILTEEQKLEERALKAAPLKPKRVR